VQYQTIYQHEMNAFPTLYKFNLPNLYAFYFLIFCVQLCIRLIERVPPNILYASKCYKILFWFIFHLNAKWQSFFCSWRIHIFFFLSPYKTKLQKLKIQNGGWWYFVPFKNLITIIILANQFLHIHVFSVKLATKLWVNKYYTANNEVQNLTLKQTWDPSHTTQIQADPCERSKVDSKQFKL
jgi:hypothetical protein